jgi:nucleotide sugar dehydrogenase
MRRRAKGMGLKEQLRKGEKRVAIWGLGYIGFSSMAYFARAGVSCIGTDKSKHRLDDVNTGQATIPNLDSWIGFKTVPLAKSGLMNSSPDWKELIKEDIAVHLVAIPTEKDGKPYHEILKDVIGKICQIKSLSMPEPPLVVVESTLTPDAIDKEVIPLIEKNGLKVGKDILLGVAPRRDWFTSSDKTLKTLPRVVGGTTPETTELMESVFSLICDTVLKAKDHKHAAIVKSIENAYRQLDITFANQLSQAYPDLDMTSILKLVGTKWNIGTYHPSFGTGGYCIPLAPQYVLEGAENPKALSLLEESLKTDFSQPEKVVESLAKRGCKKVGILGVAYMGDLKVHVLSPAITIAKKLREKGIEAKIQDPYYSEKELKEITGLGSFRFPEGLKEFDTILVVANHMEYRYVNESKIMKNLENCRLILDNMGAWHDLKFPSHIEYHEAGDAGWMK